MKPSRWTALWVQWKARVPGRGPTLDRTDVLRLGHAVSDAKDCFAAAYRWNRTE
jgi:hypothetical protein